MTADLGMDAAQVHGTARAVIDFWFALPPEKHFAKDDALDREIADRFGAVRDQVLATDAIGWREDPDTLLAAILLLDQFSRNLYRGSAQGYAADPLALELCVTAIDAGWEDRYPPERLAFVYMPLMHAESRAMQDLSVAKFTELGREENLSFARDHREVIRRYGRYPSRNAVLGRASTPEEQDYLSRPDAGW
ncbi:DUF924 family protein [Sphingomonas pseudosanguinis]|uniref:Uncharacterized protein (DUF924 family) n=1 Tax=Sphingomonas pseudosanguinis TaxID=413712 RepID=A0A7W6F3I3_9SPHN|nr:DUF924 family protein [Sphingomonas pseudosanguinis]MBB3879991.1 uncharacterized protein (DUF924 family) [Sphingomonas pseudosanguinis]MBN3537462.1 DUF924 domain-containing protein [Sphingomonas pseudosanguinis]